MRTGPNVRSFQKAVTRWEVPNGREYVGPSHSLDTKEQDSNHRMLELKGFSKTI